jgi:tetratricopeptide (TPR) repeat protein
MPQEIGQLLTEADAALNTEPSLSRQHAMAALEMAIASGNGKDIAESYYLLGKVEYVSNNPAVALEHFKKAIQHAARVHDYKTLASSQNNAGLLLFQSGKWAEAKEAYHQSLEIKERMKDEKGIAISCSNLGGVFFKPPTIRRRCTTLCVRKQFLMPLAKPPMRPPPLTTRDLFILLTKTMNRLSDAINWPCKN